MLVTLTLTAILQDDVKPTSMLPVSFSTIIITYFQSEHSSWSMKRYSRQLLKEIEKREIKEKWNSSENREIKLRKNQLRCRNWRLKVVSLPLSFVNVFFLHPPFNFSVLLSAPFHHSFTSFCLASTTAPSLVSILYHNPLMYCLHGCSPYLINEKEADISPSASAKSPTAAWHRSLPRKSWFTCC